MDKLTRTKQVITGISLIAFPVLFIIGNALHSDLLSFGFPDNAQEWVHEIHHNDLQQIGNLLEYLSAPLLIILIFSFINTINRKAYGWGIIGGMTALLGCVTMIGSKGAFCLSVAGIDTLPEAEFQQVFPALRALFEKAGMLQITWALPLLPLGFVIQSIGLLKGNYLPKRQGLLMLTGSLLLANLGIELINVIGSLLLCIGLMPVGVLLIQKNANTKIKSF
ncbi:MAG: hypothetical protein K8R54_03465 [Bacteroidales bacterium]|nr:hypothetical protein [Bacteroidales bacterium]